MIDYEGNRVTIRRCATCRSRADKISCSGYPWYSYADISFCRYQMRWLIENLPGLRLGIYPPDPQPTGYIDNPGSRRSIVSTSAKFEMPVQLAAEVDARLDKTGKDGSLLLAQVLAELPLHRDAEQALRYITGWRRMRISYARWCRDERYLTKLRSFNPRPRTGSD